MSLARKILVLAVCLTVILATLIVWFLSHQVGDSETRRARSAIGSAVRRYSDGLDEQHRWATRIVSLLMGDSQNRSQLIDVPANATQLREEILGRILQKELVVNGRSPAFQVLLDDHGKVLLASGIDETKLSGITWPVKDVLAEREPASRRRYLLIDGKLHLAFGVPLRIELDESPTHAHFAAFTIDNGWAEQLLRGRADDLPLAAVFVVDGNALARSGGNPAIEPDLERAQAARFDVQVAGEKFVAERLRFEMDASHAGVSRAGGATHGEVYVYSSLTKALEPMRQLKRSIFYVTLFSLPVIVFLIARALRSVVGKPVERLVGATRSVSAGDFSVRLPDQRRDEFGELARSFNQMTTGLQQRELIKDTLGQFVDPRIADALLMNPASLRGQRVVQSALFTDLERFTAMSEKLDPESLVQLLSGYLGACADVVKDLNGYLDKFLGDGAVAFWGPPVENDHALAACRAALRIVELPRQFDGECKRLGIPPLRVRAGAATGEALVGIIGSGTGKKNYTAMGDVMNLASRLEGVNKLYGTQILINGTMQKLVGARVLTRHLDTVRVMGRSEPVELHEVIADSAEGHCDDYQRAMELYRSRRWSEAAGAFERIGDAPSRVLALRCQGYLQMPPDAAWDGVWNLDRK